MDPILPVSTGAPLLAGSESQQDPTTLTAVGIPSHCRGSEPSQRDDVTTSGLVSEVTRRLFVSHFLSTWNSRVFEFGAVLYLANIFPQTLLPLSAYALARGASAILFSPAIGQYIDAGDRLHTVRLSIVLQRVVVAASCIAFWLLASDWPLPYPVMIGLFVLVSVLACVEKLCSIMNMVSVERDWVVVIAGQDESNLRELNSKMRRIDLVCKLAGPFVISVIDGTSTEAAILVNFGMNIISIGIEYYAIAKVYSMVPELQISKQIFEETTHQSTQSETGGILAVMRRVKDGMSRSLRDLHLYFHHRAFLPSIACAFLYFTVLNFSGQMVTYLLSVGYNSIHIAIARTVSVAFEISATWIAPAVMGRMGPVRTGLWFISWQMMCLAGAAAFFWGSNVSMISTFALVGGTILSRIGLWGFDLCTQIIIQEELEPEHRGSFSSVEASWQNAFELCSYIMTIIFSRPDQFQWPVLSSCIAVFTAGGLYTIFVRSRRGHLFHLPRCIDLAERKGRPGSVRYERLENI